jgi:hypothetical protein
MIGRLIWESDLKPSAFSRVYRVRIEYRPGRSPVTRVVNPVLRELSGGKKPPHVYDDAGDPLCLFYPAAREWDSSMLLSRTIVPWACEWLLHFEAWLYTGIWEGGGVEHQPAELGESGRAIVN